MEKTLLTALRQGQLPHAKVNVPKRHRNSWGYQDENSRYFLGTFSAKVIPAHVTDKMYVLEANDVARPDLLAYKMYGNPSYYWVILWLNGILDPFEGMYPGMVLRIPTRSRLNEFGVSL